MGRADLIFMIDIRRTAVTMIRERIPDPIAIYLFGSRTADAVHDSSDLDVAVLGREPLAAERCVGFMLGMTPNRWLRSSDNLK